MNKNLLVAIGIVGSIAVIVLILLMGGGGGGTGDGRGDVQVSGGETAPDDPNLADIVDASVRRDGGALVFEATLGTAIPKRIPDGSLTLRWDVAEGETDTWIVSADLNLGPTAAVTSHRSDYGASTIDDTLPGSVEINGDTLRVTVQPGEIDGFPTDFTWRLSTALDADRTDTASATATDTAPDSGAGTVDG